MCKTVDKDYDEKKLFPLVLAVDFDGTLVENAFPGIGKFNDEVLAAVKAYKGMGWKIILWSCRTDEMLEDAVKACEAQGLIFDAVNDNLPEVQAYFRGNTRKVFANLYWDDRNAVLVRNHTTLFNQQKSISILEAMPLAIDTGIVAPLPVNGV